MHCPHCGQEHPESTLFCPLTGQKMPRPDECPHCGRTVDPTWPHCAYCGHKLLDADESSPPPEVQPEAQLQAPAATSAPAEPEPRSPAGCWRKIASGIAALFILAVAAVTLVILLAPVGKHAPTVTAPAAMGATALAAKDETAPASGPLTSHEAQIAGVITEWRPLGQLSPNSTGVFGGVEFKLKEHPAKIFKVVADSLDKAFQLGIVAPNADGVDEYLDLTGWQVAVTCEESEDGACRVTALGRIRRLAPTPEANAPTAPPPAATVVAATNVPSAGTPEPAATEPPIPPTSTREPTETGIPLVRIVVQGCLVSSRVELWLEFAFNPGDILPGSQIDSQLNNGTLELTLPGGEKKIYQQVPHSPTDSDRVDTICLPAAIGVAKSPPPVGTLPLNGMSFENYGDTPSGPQILIPVEELSGISTAGRYQISWQSGSLRASVVEFEWDGERIALPEP